MVRPENSSGGPTWRQLMIPRRFSSVCGAAFASLIAPIETRFIDTRTNAREEHSFMTLEFRRAR